MQLYAHMHVHCTHVHCTLTQTNIDEKIYGLPEVKFKLYDSHAHGGVDITIYTRMHMPRRMHALRPVYIM